MTERYEDDFEDDIELSEGMGPVQDAAETGHYPGPEAEDRSHKVGRTVDFYTRDGRKASGKVVKNTDDEIHFLEPARPYKNPEKLHKFKITLGGPFKEADLEEGKYDYPKDLTRKPRQIDDMGNTSGAKQREARKTFRAKQKAKAHRDLMSGKVQEEATSSAAETLAPNSKPTNLDSKTGLMAAAMAAIGGMSKEDLSHFLNDALAQIGQEAANIDGGAAAKNAATIQMKPSAAGSAVKEDLDELFGDDLSEEFKDQASTLFEAAVQARIIVETAALEEAYEEALNEHVEEITAGLVEKVDDYLTYVAEQWVAENEVAIESALKVEVMEDFVNGLKDLFVENYIEIPSGKTDVLEDLVLTVEELEDKLNSVLNENIELKKELNEKVIDDTFETVAEGLAATQIEKLRTLSEGVDYNSVEDYKKKLTLIRGRLVENKRVSTNIITEEAPAYSSEYEETPKSGFVDSDVRNYVSAISRTVKK